MGFRGAWMGFRGSLCFCLPRRAMGRFPGSMSRLEHGETCVLAEFL